VATAGVVELMGAQYGPRWFDGFWDPRFPGQISPRHVVAEPLGAGNVIELEGEPLHVIELGHTDTDGSSALHAPSIGLVVAGDAVYGDVHMYLAESKDGGRVQWLDALDALDALGALERLAPTAVVSGHKRDGDLTARKTSRAPAATSSSSTSPPRRPLDTRTCTRRWSPSTRTGSTAACCGTPQNPSCRKRSKAIPGLNMSPRGALL
jgi:glyoxylase-like metal-dependent hydrolase (beta-lactamase superfamily II)